MLHGLVPHAGRRAVAEPAPTQAMVFQRPFMLRLSVWNNLRLALWLAGVPAAGRAARAAEALHRARALRSCATARRGRCRAASSSGSRWRAPGRSRPALLFLDEPTANLDPSAKKEIEAMLAGFLADGMTLVMSTHNLGQAKRLATRVVYLDRGEVARRPADRALLRRALRRPRRAVPQGRAEVGRRVRAGARRRTALAASCRRRGGHGARPRPINSPA